MKKIIYFIAGVFSSSLLFYCCTKTNTVTVTKPCLPVLIDAQCARDLAAIDHHITVPEAKDLLNRYKNLKDLILNGTFKDSADLFFNSEDFNRDAVYELLSGDSVAGIRISLGMTPERKLNLVLTRVVPPCDSTFHSRGADVDLIEPVLEKGQRK